MCFHDSRVLNKPPMIRLLVGCMGGILLVPFTVEGTIDPGHDRMITELAEVASNTLREHPYLGQAKVLKLREQIAQFDDQSSATIKHRIYLEAAGAEMEAGEVTTAIQYLEQAYALMDRAFIDDHKQTLTKFQLGTAYLRLGEVENCCLRHEAESCILPIQGGGLHTIERGSREAIRYFSEVLEAGSRQEFFYYAARWLLNIAYMTLDEYPSGVPEEYRIAPEAFTSSREFPQFTNIAPRLGLSTYNLAGGAVVDDFDGDGYLDIVTSTWAPDGALQFFRNQRDGTFKESHETAGLEGLVGGLNLVQADYNNDGFVDLLVLRGGWLGKAGRHPNSLLRNNGDGTFTDVTFAAGLGGEHYPTQTAAWADYDNDGHLDLYVGNEYSEGAATYGNTTFEGLASPSQLFHNNGDGTFTEVGERAGVSNRGFTKGVSWGDFDQDGWPDLCVSNYGGSNRLYHNNGDRTFTDVAFATGVNRPKMSFPCWFWDMDNDGALDLYIASYTGHVASVGAHFMGLAAPLEMPGVFKGDGQGGFEQVASGQGLDYPILPMGSNFGDIDNDGFLDFYLGTGDPNYWSLMPNVLFLNRGGDGFDNVTMASGMGHLQKGHAVAFADLDNDGDLDVFEQMGGAYPGDRFSDALYENPGFGRNSLTIKLVGVTTNRSAIGARIHAVIREGEQTRSIFRWVNSGGSFGGNPLRQHIGLGSSPTVERLEIYWPTSGETQVFTNLVGGRTIQITEGDSAFMELELDRVSLRSSD